MNVFTVVGLSVAAVGLSVPSAEQSANADYVDASGLSVIVASHDRVVPEEMRDAYAAFDALSEAYPDDFGYASPNLVDGKLTLGVVTAKGSTALNQLISGAALAPTAALGDSTEAAQKRSAVLAQASKPAAALPAVTKSVTRSRASVEKDKDALIEWSRDARFAGADIWQTSVERSTGRVVLTAANLTPELAKAIVAGYGTDRVAVQIEENPELQLNVGRLADNSPFYGGSRITTPSGGGCSDAFSWRVDTISAMVTAGHCAPSGGSISTPSMSLGYVNSGTRENWNNGTGTVTVSGYSGYHGDGAIIQVSSGKSSAGYVYRGANNSTSSSSVLGMWSRRAQSGDQYCTGGSYGGEICGWTVSATQVNVTYDSGDIGRNEVRSSNKQGWCTRAGDSGGSVFTATSSGVTAKGVHNGGGGGGSDSYGGALDQCHEIFTDIWDIYYGLPGYLE